MHFFAGKFADAAKYFLDAYRVQPGYLGGVELLKAAQSRYMEGNLNEADQLYSQWEKPRSDARDPSVDLRRAEWLYITGRRPDAMKTAQAAAANPNPSVSAYALCHLALWSMDSGDRTKAADFAARAAQLATGSIVPIAGICKYIVSPAPGPEGQRIPDFARAYAALFANRPAEAVNLLTPIYAQSSPNSDADIRTLYAWALFEAGQRDQARPLLERFPIPLGAADNPIFMTQLFPRFLALRSSIAGSTGNTPARP